MNCSSITIRKSYFLVFGLELYESETFVYVDPNYGMQYQGKILNLNGFAGPIEITKSYFVNSRLKFKD